MAPLHAAVIAFSSSRDCFITLPANWMKNAGTNQDITVFKIQHGQNQKAYVTSKADSSPSYAFEVEVLLNGKYALALGLNNKEQILIQQLETNVAHAKKVFLEPMKADDWEILQLNAQTVETDLLSQIRVVWKDQVFPVWVFKSTFFVKVAQVEPDVEPSVLQEWTEIHVIPKDRVGFKPFASTSSSTELRNKDIYAQYKHLRKRNIKVSPGSASSLSPTSDDSSSSKQSQNSLIDTPKNMAAVNNYSFLRYLINSVLPNEHQFSSPASDVKVTDDFFPLELDFCLRVIPMSKQAKEVKPLPLALQATTVFISVGTFISNIESETIPDCFVATLSKVLSPSEKKEKTQAFFASQSANKMSRDKMKIKKEKDDTNISSDDKKIIVYDSVCVNVIVLKSVREEFDAPEALFRSSNLIAVPRELKRRLGLEVSSLVQCHGVQIKPLFHANIVLYPLESKPMANFNEESVTSAFVKYVDDANLEDSSLVISDGTLVQLPIRKGKMCDFVVALNQTENLDANSSYASQSSSPPQSWSSTESESGSPISLNLPNYTFLRRDKLDKINLKLGAYSLHICKSVWCYSSTLHKIHHLYQGVPALRLEALGGVKEITEKAMSDFEFWFKLRPIAFIAIDASMYNGCMLICGPKGVGKTTLVKALSKKLVTHPYYIYISTIECLPLRGKRIETIAKKWDSALAEAAHRQPSLLLFEDLDYLASAPATPEQEAGPDGLYFGNIVQTFICLMDKIVTNKCNIVVVVTSKSTHSLHPALTNTRGRHLFKTVLEIQPPNMLQRNEILQSQVMSKLHLSSNSVQSVDWSVLASKTEGYVAQDLDALTDRATHAAWIRTNFSSEEDSTEKRDPVTLTDYDFEAAFEGYTPASLRGLQLQKGNTKTWSDVGGLHHVKKVIQQILTWPVKYKELFKNCALKPQSSILLYGAPGTGKTLLAGAVANECALNFISIKGPELLSKYIGASEQAVRDLFTRAQSAKPCILFFDEFDALAPRRGHDSTGVTDRVVNQLLTQMDGVESMQGVYVLAATSRPELIDPALLRPGRLDKCLLCPLPDESERLEILEALSSKLSLSDDIDFKAIAPMAEFFSGADLQALLYSAQLEALHDSQLNSSRRRSTNPEDIDFSALCDRITFMPTLEKGSIEPSFEEGKKLMQEINVITTNTLGGNMTVRSGGRRRHSTISVAIQQIHLTKVLSQMKPSVSLQERQRYEQIFKQFQGSGGDFSPSVLTDVKRVTLA